METQPTDIVFYELTLYQRYGTREWGSQVLVQPHVLEGGYLSTLAQIADKGLLDEAGMVLPTREWSARPVTEAEYRWRSRVG